MIQIVFFNIIDVIVFIFKGWGALICSTGIVEIIDRIISKYLNIHLNGFFAQIISLTSATGILIYTKRWKILPTIVSMIITAAVSIMINLSRSYPPEKNENFTLFLIQIITLIVVNYTFFYRTSLRYANQQNYWDRS